MYGGDCLIVHLPVNSLMYYRPSGMSLPSSNGKIEQSFSRMNVVKTNKRSLLSNDTLNDLLLLGALETLLLSRKTLK